MPAWNDLFLDKQHQWKDKHPLVAELAEQLKERPDARILDLGSGAGRHLVYLAQQGYQVVGMDCAENGLSASRTWLEQQGLQSSLVRADMTALPFADQSFDALLSIHVIFHNTLALIQRSLNEIDRVTRPGAPICLTFQSTLSYRYGSGQEIEPGTFLPEIGIDAFIPHHFSDFTEICQLLRAFDIRKIELNDHLNPEGVRSVHWNAAVLRK
jgi:tellurite methyltransferase